MAHEPIICIKTSAFYALLDEIIMHLNEKHHLSAEHRWVDTETAMRFLNVKSRTTLQELRDSGQIRFSQPKHKHIVYDRISIEEYFEKHARETF